MKCRNCDIKISAKFAAAIANNCCPACGKKILSLSEYDKIAKVADQLRVCGFEDDLRVGVAAALSSKFTLVPKDLNLEDVTEEIEPDIEEEKNTPLTKNQKRLLGQTKFAARVAASRKNHEDDEDDDDLSPEEEEKINREWGLDEERSGGDIEISQELVSEIENMDNPAQVVANMLPPISSINKTIANAKHEELLQRAAAAKNDPSKFKVSRIG